MTNGRLLRSRILAWASSMLVVVPLLASPPAPAPAVAPLGESLAGAAKGDYETARQLFEDGDFAGAFIKFKGAYDLSGDARLLWNMATCKKNQRKYVQVLRLVERYEREGGQSLTAQQRADAAEIVRTVRALVSTVHL